jgi:hypothetical protein
MKKLAALIILPFLALAPLTGCANPHFFPRMKPLFVGFDERRLSSPKHTALEHAKVDFQRARGGKEPVYARYVRTEPYSQTKVYQGDGYELTLVDDGTTWWHKRGPQIVLDATLTGGKPYRYDEVDEETD